MRPERLGTERTRWWRRVLGSSRHVEDSRHVIAFSADHMFGNARARSAHSSREKESYSDTVPNTNVTF